MILVALGSNVGDRAAYLELARQQLQHHGVSLLATSSISETEALLPPNAPPDWNTAFLNQVLSVQTTLPADALMALLKKIEVLLGRLDRGRWGPREIDLDLLSYDDIILGDPTLTLPHPQLHLRDFVLRPVAEIAPHWHHPILQKTASEMLETL